jgi:YD repeat-containing protein
MAPILALLLDDAGTPNATFVSQTVPAKMIAGRSYPVTVVMQNTGTSIWTALDGYQLGSQNPAGNTVWGTARIALGASVAPGQQYTFAFTVVAPSTAGARNFQWQMVQGSQSFGALTPNVSIPVETANANFISQSVPASMTAGQSYPVSIVLQNTGTSTWSAADGYQLTSQNPAGNTIWGLSSMPLGASVAPGQQYTFAATVTAPSTAGTKNFQWQMTASGIAFGTATPNVAVTDTLPPAPTVTVTRMPSPMVAGQPVILNWSSTNANSLSVNCTSTGTGYAGTNTLATSGSSVLTADAAWVGYPSTCTYTATGLGGTGTYVETLTTNAAATSYTWQYGYDAMGRLNTVVDPRNQSSYMHYDSLGRLQQTEQPANTGASTPTLTSFGWDLQDNLTSVTDPRNLTTSYTVNGLGNVTGETSPDRGNPGYTYDANGNVLTSTDARGKTTTYTYDSLNRLKTISYPTGTGTTFEYDGGATQTPQEAGELTKITDESGQTTYAHDAMGRLITKTVTIGAKTFTVTYGWGDSGPALDKLTSITYPSGNKISYSYDTYGSISGISITPAGGSAQTLLSNITYNADNNPTGWQWSDGKARPIGYDTVGMALYTLGDPAGTGNKAGVYRTVQRDAAGRITGYTHTSNSGPQSALDQSFAYDNLNRLTSQTINGTSYAYTYDANGNRTSKIVGGTIYTNTVSATSNRYTQTQDVSGTAAPQYDSAGNTTTDGVNTYTYSDRGRMSSATTTSGNVTFLYNGLEQRAYKTSSLGTSYYA